jgi:16S rRNA (guanine527-N7)-methyltransferase
MWQNFYISKNYGQDLIMNLSLKKNNSFDEIKKFHQLDEKQIKALEDYIEFLLQENNKFNFIGESTIDDIWSRHVLDSAQLLRFIDNKNSKFADFGSGAGFPGIVLSILGLREIHLIEKSFRKAEFLNKAKLFSDKKIFVQAKRLEDLGDIKFDSILSRAFAPLNKLLDYTIKFLKKDGYCLFLKGKNLDLEIENAKKQFQFEYQLHPSLTSKESNIIKIFNINLKTK